MPQAKLGVLAGGGCLPARIAEAVRGQGREVFIVAFEGQTDPDAVKGLPHFWTRMGAAGSTIARLRQEGVSELVFAGPVKRPSFTEIMPDWWGAKFLARVGARALGDDGLLRSIARALESEGFRVVGLHELLSELLAPEGVISAMAPDEQAWRDIEQGKSLARAMGELDVGQGAVIQQGLVLAVEAIEGTDAMLARCAALARPGVGGVLVKMAKPQQDRRLDLPTMGVETVINAAHAGLRGIALEAGSSLLIDQAAVVAKADELGLFVVGIKPPVPEQTGPGGEEAR